MGLFSRRKSSHSEPATGSGESRENEETLSSDSGESDAERPADASATGPWDSSEAPEHENGRLDLGSLRLPAIPGMQIRLDAPGPDQPPMAAVVALGGSTLELRAFAAPRTAGIWEDLRADIAEELTRSGAKYRIHTGAHGPEILAHIPTQGPGGASTATVRFIGVDGPRWFLRGVLQGPAATDDAAAESLRAIFDDVVVVRDGQARPPREILPLRQPDTAPAASASEESTLLDVMSPGPTIAEVR